MIWTVHTRSDLSIIGLLLGICLTLCDAKSGAAQRYDEVASTAGLNTAWEGNGVAVADYDRDGDLDLYHVSRKSQNALDSRSWNRLFQNQGDGTFIDVTISAGVRADFLPEVGIHQFGSKVSASWADYDNDGDPDLFLANVGPEVLFRNNGDGTFTDVANQAGLQVVEQADNEAENVGGLWWDYDVDGFLDLYISSWTGNNRFYRNSGDGTFEDLSTETGLGLADRTWMAMPYDFNTDGLPDLYLANDFGPNQLFLNQGGNQFLEATAEFGLYDAGESMGIAFGDVNHDSFPELFITNNTAARRYFNSFFLARPGLPYQESAVAFGLEDTNWGWGTEFFDADNDGDLDLFAVNGAFLENDTPNRLFKNLFLEDGLLSFDDISESSRTDGRAESHGLVVFDLEYDGDLDMLVSNYSEPVYLLRNRGVIGKWFKVDLEGTLSNRDGLGASLMLRSGGVTMYRENDAIDFLGQSIQPVHFGLGTVSQVDELHIKWPSGRVDTWLNLSINQIFRAVEGSGIGVDVESPDSRVPNYGISNSMLKTYPMPALDNVTIQYENSEDHEKELSVFTISGQEVLSLQIPPSSSILTEVKLDVSELPNGLYLIRLAGNRSTSIGTGSFLVLR